MAKGPPKTIALANDDYSAKYVGRTADGRQFFLTNSFRPLAANPPEEPGEDWSVIVEPGNYMCFWPPWTSGDYDT